jgi:hypothetical protein
MDRGKRKIISEYILLTDNTHNKKNVHAEQGAALKFLSHPSAHCAKAPFAQDGYNSQKVLIKSL